MKTKLSAVALVASAVTIAQANPGGVHAVAGGSHRGAVARSAPAVHAPMRAGGVSSFRPTPMRSYGNRPFYSGQRSSSFGMRSSPCAPCTGGLSIRVEVRSRVPVHIRWQLSRNAIVSRHSRIAETQLSPGCGTSETPEPNSGMETIYEGTQTICGTQTISEMETIICGVTGKNTFSLTAQGIGIATGTATATIGGMATNAPSLMDRG